MVSAKKKRAVKTELAKDTTQRYRSLPITSAQDHIQKVAQQRYRNEGKISVWAKIAMLFLTSKWLF